MNIKAKAISGIFNTSALKVLNVLSTKYIISGKILNINTIDSIATIH